MIRNILGQSVSFIQSTYYIKKKIYIYIYKIWKYKTCRKECFWFPNEIIVPISAAASTTIGLGCCFLSATANGAAIFECSRHWKVKTTLNVGDDFKILSGFFEIEPVFSVVKWKWSVRDYHDASKSPNKRCKSRGLPHKLLRLGKSLLHWWKNSYVLFFRNHYDMLDISIVCCYSGGVMSYDLEFLYKISPRCLSRRLDSR